MFTVKWRKPSSRLSTARSLQLTAYSCTQLLEVLAVSCRLSTVSSALLTILLGPALSFPALSAIDDSRLWLPKNYEHYFSKLRRAARTAEKTDRCESVVRGQLHQERSRPDHPVYRIICRDIDRVTYSVLIDGLTYEDLTPADKRKNSLSAAQLQSMRDDKYWEICQRELSARTGKMMGLTWLTEAMPAPDRSEALKEVFAVDFNAHDIQKQPLRYRAYCTFTREQESDDEKRRRQRAGELLAPFSYSVRISPRRQ